MITKVQKVHKVIVDLLDLGFSRSIHFLGFDDRYQVNKDDGHIFNPPTQEIQKIENVYNMEGPKGPEVIESNKT